MTRKVLIQWPGMWSLAPGKNYVKQKTTSVALGVLVNMSCSLQYEEKQRDGAIFGLEIVERTVRSCS